jgi:proteasome lid subunit RPN8/RPN11
MQIAATITDTADIRAYECLLPDSVEVSRIAVRLAELTHLPLVGPDGRPMLYGLVPKGGSLLDPHATLSELNLPCPLTLRLVPEIAAGKDGVQLPDEPEADEVEAEPEWDITIGEPMALVHDAELDSRPDVRIDAEVHKKIEEFAAANRNKECAGLLLGTVDTEGKTRVIHICAAIPADGAVGTRASVRIPLVAWEAMLRVRDFDYPELRVLGWFHTHAGWGVFMSDSDIFIHRHFFPHPNMVAYVLDPTTGRDGFFYWHDGKIGLCPSYGLVGASADVGPHKPHAPSTGSGCSGAEPAAPRARFDLRNWIIAALVLGVLYLAFAGSPFGRRSQEIGKPKPGKAKVTKQQVVVTKELAASHDGVYVIGKRDNPWSICNRAYHDGDLGPALMRYNHLSNVVGLQVGQRIKLPSKQTLRRLRKR